MAKIRATQSLDIFIKIMNWIAKKLKKEEPQNSIHRIQINKVDCCENCGNTAPDGMYYEFTYNGDKDELYMDAYKKWENICYKM